MDAAQTEVQLNFDIVASWRAAYIPNLNCDQPTISHPPVLQPGERCYSPISTDSMDSVTELPVYPLPGPSTSSEIGREFCFTDDPNIQSEGFQVQRRDLEELVAAKGSHGTAMLLYRIMRITNTFVHWPQDFQDEENPEDQLFVWIFGAASNNIWAKSLIQIVLHTRGNLIKMNIALPECEHLHLNEPAGTTMDSTGTQIIFGDPDRLDAVGSHKVTLYGAIESLEQARASLRSAMPFTMIFDVHLTGRMSHLRRKPYIKQMEEQLNIKLRFFKTMVTNVYRVAIRGTDVEALKIQEVVDKFLTTGMGEVMKPSFRLEMPVSKDVMEIFTKDDILKIVMANTDTEIFFMKSTEAEGCSDVIITGSVADVHNARRELVGFLPVELGFEIDGYEQYTDQILDLANKYALQLGVQTRDDVNTLSITMIGTERFVHNIYDAYQELLRLKDIPMEEPYLDWAPEVGRGSEAHPNSSDWLLMESNSSSLDGWNYFDLAHRSSTPKHFYSISDVGIN